GLLDPDIIRFGHVIDRRFRGCIFPPAQSSIPAGINACAMSAGDKAEYLAASVTGRRHGDHVRRIELDAGSVIGQTCLRAYLIPNSLHGSRVTELGYVRNVRKSQHIIALKSPNFVLLSAVVDKKSSKRQPVRSSTAVPG